ncbi:MAG: hypothetical protein QN131_05925 [Armatimonadota bacterium]|nr:hypothetical protein [Armatimonadota bacterium]
MKWLRRWLAPPERQDAGRPTAFLLDVRCGMCGEVITVRVDPRYELRQDLEDGQDVRILDKDVMGSRCFALLHVHAVMTPDLTLRAHEVSGGELVGLRRADAG